MSLILQGSTSGSITLQEPAVAGTTVLTLPATTGNVVVDGATQTLTNKTLTSPTFGGTPTGVGVLTSGTAVASTSGTSIDFTGIPSWVKRITVMFSGVSTNGTSNPLFQLGDSGGFETTSYVAASTIMTTGVSTSTYTTGFGIATALATNALSGSVVFTSFGSNTWIACGVMASSTNSVSGTITGTKTLSDTLDRVRITTVNGTDTFDAGSINILYE